MPHVTVSEWRPAQPKKPRWFPAAGLLALVTAICGLTAQDPAQWFVCAFGVLLTTLVAACNRFVVWDARLEGRRLEVRFLGGRRWHGAIEEVRLSGRRSWRLLCPFHGGYAIRRVDSGRLIGVFYGTIERLQLEAIFE